MAEITDFGPRKTIFILAIVVGCFAVLWPKIFYPMLTATYTHHPTSDSSGTIRQERRTPPHAGGMHPAMRERGRAIPSSHIVPKIVDRADHIIPKMRPPLGGAGHVVPAAKGNGTMGIIMPLYTIGIILFFVYTIVKVLKKSSDSEIISEYPGAAAEKEFRKMVFSPEAFATAMTGGTLHYPRERSPHMTAPTIEELKDQAAGDIEIDQLRQRLVETEAAMERIVVQMGNISRSVMQNSGSQPEIKEDTAGQESPSREGEELDAAEQSPTVKVMGMEMTASCESGQKCSRPTTPIIPTPPSNLEREKTPPKPIYLEGALPSQCELLVTDSETQAEKSEDDDDAPVVLSGKMTLSLISLDQIPADLEEKRENKKNLDIQGEVAIDKKQKGDEKKVEVEEAKIVSGIVKSMEEKKEELKEDEDEQGINAEEDDVEEDVEEDVDEEDVDEEDADEEDADEEDADEEDADEEDVVEEGVDEEDVDDEEDDDEEEYVAKEEVVDEEEDVDEEDGEDEEEKDNDKRYRVYADKALDSDEKN
nr:PREDICTED: resistance to inhibitors of cholinesterase protein 3-like isoform X3 [Linepithema humile]